jgi:hypothetical protein
MSDQVGTIYTERVAKQELRLEHDVLGLHFFAF